MNQSTMMEKLKEVNVRAAEVAKEVAATNDPQIIQAIITEFGNFCWVKGVNEGQGKKDNGSVTFD